MHRFVHFKFSLAGVFAFVSLFACGVALFRVLPADGRNALLLTSPFSIPLLFLACLPLPPRPLAAAFAITHVLVASACLIWAMLARDDLEMLGRFLPVLWVNVHLLLLQSVSGIDFSLFTCFMFVVLGTLSWALVGLIIGLLKHLFARPCARRHQRSREPETESA